MLKASACLRPEVHPPVPRQPHRLQSAHNPLRPAHYKLRTADLTPSSLGMLMSRAQSCGERKMIQS